MTGAKSNIANWHPGAKKACMTRLPAAFTKREAGQRVRPR